MVSLRVCSQEAHVDEDKRAGSIGSPSVNWPEVVVWVMSLGVTGWLEICLVASSDETLTPASLHVRLSLTILPIVIVEKCFTLSSAEADEVIAAQTEYAPDKVLTVFQSELSLSR